MVDPFDIIGPVMVGPSSSHTAGAVRLGRIARAAAGGSVVAADIGLHGSFATTYKGHGTDAALVAGLLGMGTDDERIPDALRIARDVGLDVRFRVVDLEDAHPNTAVIAVTNESCAVTEVVGSSVGGGRVVVSRLDGFRVNLTGAYPTWVIPHLDRPGVVAAVAGALSSSGVNIAGMTVARKQKGAEAIMVIEVDHPGPVELQGILAELPNVLGVRYIEPIAL